MVPRSAKVPDDRNFTGVFLLICGSASTHVCVHGATKFVLGSSRSMIVVCRGGESSEPGSAKSRAVSSRVCYLGSDTCDINSVRRRG